MAKLISAESALGALLESLVNPTLDAMKPFGLTRRAKLDIPNQMEAVAWLYNQYLCQELPDLVALDWEDLCNKASNLQEKLSKFVGVGKPALSRSLTPTEQRVKNACEAAEAQKNPNNFRKNILVTKVCVCLLNFRQDECLLALGATTKGVWSFIEKEKLAQCNKKRKVWLSDNKLAFEAIQEQTGIKANVLRIEDSFLIINDLNRAGGSTKFFIMTCMGTFDLSPAFKFRKTAWTSLDSVFSKSSDPLIDSSGSNVHSTLAVQYFHLRPFCSSLENWLTRQQLMKSLVQLSSAAAEENLKNEKEMDLVMAKTGASNEENSVIIQQQRLLKPKVDEVALKMQLFAPTAKKKSEEEDKQRLSTPEVDGVALNMKLPAAIGSPQEDKQRLSKAEVDGVALNTKLFAPIGSRHSLIGRVNTQTHAVGKEDKECARAELCVTSAGGINGGEKSHCIHQAQVDDKHKQRNLEVDIVGSNTNFALALTNRIEVSASRDGGTIEELPIPAKGQDYKARQIDPNNNAVAPDTNMTAPHRSPQSSTKINRKEEVHMLDEAGALLSFKTAYRSVKKKRKNLCKELRDHIAQTDLLYKQISESNSDLARLVQGGKAGLQLAVQLCNGDGQKQTPSLDIGVDQLQPDGALLKSSKAIGTSQAETSYKKRPFQMLKSSVQELKEVCTRNEWPLPSYGVFSSKNKKRQCLYSGKVKIRGNDFELLESGEASETAKAAKLSAAAYMLSTLHLLKARKAVL